MSKATRGHPNQLDDLRFQEHTSTAERSFFQIKTYKNVIYATWVPFWSHVLLSHLIFKQLTSSRPSVWDKSIQEARHILTFGYHAPERARQALILSAPLQRRSRYFAKYLSNWWARFTIDKREGCSVKTWCKYTNTATDGCLSNPHISLALSGTTFAPDLVPPTCGRKGPQHPRNQTTKGWTNGAASQITTLAVRR